MAKHGTRAQRDLFEEPPPEIGLGAAERAKAMKQLQRDQLNDIRVRENQRDVYASIHGAA